MGIQIFRGGGTQFLTMLERPPGVEGLVASPEQTRAIVAAIRNQMSELILDPEVSTYDIGQLAMVRGE